MYRHLKLWFEFVIQFRISFGYLINSIWNVFFFNEIGKKQNRNLQKSMIVFLICNVIYGFVVGLYTFNVINYGN